MKDGIVSQFLTDGIFCAAKKKANEELYKSFKNTWQGKITIKIIGIQKKLDTKIASTYYVHKRLPAQRRKWLEGLRTADLGME